MTPPHHINLGTLRWRPSRPGSEEGRWYVDTRDGVPWFRVDGATRKGDRPKAEKYRDELAAARTTLQAVQVRKDVRGETCAEWFERYYEACELGLVGRKNRGRPQAAAETRAGRFAVHLKSILGDVLMSEVNASQIRAVVRYLDEQIRIRLAFYADASNRGGRKPGLSAKTAKHIFGEVKAGFREAVHSKRDDLRVLKSDPTIGVLPPDGGDTREQAALYPAELVALLCCDDVPMWRREAYALAAYLGPRLGELGRLTAAHVDVAHGTVRIPGTKTDAAKRTVKIHPHLRPLLERLVRESPTGPLVRLPVSDGKNGAAAHLKRDMLRAQLKRPELWRDDDTHLPMNFHGLRHTCITHWCVAGEDISTVMAMSGHTNAQMTQHYLDKAAIARAGFGKPHPPLPEALVSGDVTSHVTKGPKSLKSLSGRRDLNPRRQAPKACALPGCATPRRRNEDVLARTWGRLQGDAPRQGKIADARERAGLPAGGALPAAKEPRSPRRCRVTDATSRPCGWGRGRGATFLGDAFGEEARENARSSTLPLLSTPPRQVSGHRASEERVDRSFEQGDQRPARSRDLLPRTPAAAVTRRKAGHGRSGVCRT